jgi:hypothetical protein
MGWGRHAKAVRHPPKVDFFEFQAFLTPHEASQKLFRSILLRIHSGGPLSATFWVLPSPVPGPPTGSKSVRDPPKVDFLGVQAFLAPHEASQKLFCSILLRIHSGGPLSATFWVLPSPVPGLPTGSKWVSDPPKVDFFHTCWILKCALPPLLQASHLGWRMLVARRLVWVQGLMHSLQPR